MFIVAPYPMRTLPMVGKAVVNYHVLQSVHGVIEQSHALSLWKIRLVDEQNGFRPGRSYQDHMYVLSSVKNRKAMGENTFCAFVDGPLFNALYTIYD